MSYKKRPNYHWEDSANNNSNDYRLKKLKIMKVQPQHQSISSYDDVDIEDDEDHHINNNNRLDLSDRRATQETNTARILLSLAENNHPFQLTSNSPSSSSSITSTTATTTPPSPMPSSQTSSNNNYQTIDASPTSPNITNKYTSLSSYINSDNNDPEEDDDDDDDDKPLDLRKTNGVQQGLTEEVLQSILKENKVVDVIKHTRCMVCEKAFSGLLELAKHHCEKLIQRVYNCTQCHKTYRTNANLHSHLRWCRRSNRMNPSVSQNCQRVT